MFKKTCIWVIFLRLYALTRQVWSNAQSRSYIALWRNMRQLIHSWLIYFKSINCGKWSHRVANWYSFEQIVHLFPNNAVSYSNHGFYMQMYLAEFSVERKCRSHGCIYMALVDFLWYWYLYTMLYKIWNCRLGGIIIISKLISGIWLKMARMCCRLVSSRRV